MLQRLEPKLGALRPGQKEIWTSLARRHGARDHYSYMEDPAAGTGAPGAGGGQPHDIVVQRSGNDLVVGVKDPAHPGVPFGQLTDQITQGTGPLR
jgi:hypothetical protein